jgi:hypothetical protein
LPAETFIQPSEMQYSSTVVRLLALEADADAARQRVLIEMLAEGVDRKAVGRKIVAVSHGQRLCRKAAAELAMA